MAEDVFKMATRWLMMELSWPPDGSKSLQDGFKLSLFWLLDRIFGPRSRKMTEACPKIFPRWPTMAPRWPHDGPTTPPRWLKKASRCLQIAPGAPPPERIASCIARAGALTLAMQLAMRSGRGCFEAKGGGVSLKTPRFEAKGG